VDGAGRQRRCLLRQIKQVVWNAGLNNSTPAGSPGITAARI
jgi:hypothetical protein